MDAKNSPVDRGNVLFSLECCRSAECECCPYYFGECSDQATDVLAYIMWLEDQLEEAKMHDCS